MSILEFENQIKEKLTRVEAERILYKQQLKILKNQKQTKLDKYLGYVGDFFDYHILNIADKYTEIAKDIRYRKENKEGYVADKIIDGIGKSVKKYEKQLKKNSLSENDIEILIKLQTALRVIVTKQIGRKIEEAKILIQKIISFLPEVKQSQIGEAEKMINGLNELIENIKLAKENQKN